jgi:hypothetical protein
MAHDMSNTIQQYILGTAHDTRRHLHGELYPSSDGWDFFGDE